MQAPPLPPSLDFPRLKVLAVGNSGTGKSCLIKRYCEARFVNKYIPTIGIDYGVKKIDVKPAAIAQHRQKLQASGLLTSSADTIGNSTSAAAITAVRVNFWDVAGGEESLHIRNEFYAPAQGILFVYDTRDTESFKALDKWLEEVRAYTSSGSQGGQQQQQPATRRTSHTTTSNTPAGRAVGDLNGTEPILYLIANKVDDVATTPGESTQRVISEADGRRWAESHGCAAYYETSASSDLNVTTALEALFYDVMAKFYM